MKNDIYKKNKSKTAIISLIVIVLILLAIIIWALVAKPAINNYVIKKQVEAQDIVIQSILLQIKQQGYVQIQNAEGATTLIEYTANPESA